MPELTLTSNAVSYDLYTLLSAIDADHPRNCAHLAIKFPMASVAAANSGGQLKIGRPNAARTDVPSPDLILEEGDSQTIEGGDLNTVYLKGRYLKASVNNAVVEVTAIVR